MLVEDLLPLLEEHGLAHGMLARALYAALRTTEPLAVVEAVAPGMVTLRFAASNRWAVLVDGSGGVAVTALAAVIKAHLAQGVEVCLVADDDQQRAAVKQAVPFYTGAGVAQYRLDNQGRLHTLAQVGLNKPPLFRGLENLPPPPDRGQWDAVHQTRANALALMRQDSAALTAFAQSLRARKAPVTWGLVAALLGVFALEMALGVGTTGPVWVLRRLGALDAQRVVDGQWWRLISCTFLHGGFMHLGFNTLVLVMLGTSLEKILGSARFAVLYAVSGVVGSVASAWSMQGGGTSVGASGALWGLLAAEAALVFLPGSPLPAVLRVRARRTVVQNLTLNLLNSFRPHVDMAAHFGGGLAGAALVFASLRTLHSNSPEPQPTAPRAGRAINMAAVALGMLYAAGLAVALIQADVPAAWAGPQPVAVRVPQLGVTVQVPAVISAAHRLEGKPGETATVAFGHLEQDPLVMGVMVHLADGGELDVEAEAQAVLTAWSQVPDGATLAATATLQTVGAGRLLTRRLVLANGLHLDTALMVAPGGWCRAEAGLWPGSAAAYQDAAAHAARSAFP